MSALALQLPDVVDPYDEALAYEYLYSIPHSSLKTISEQTVNRGVLPTEALDEIIVLQDEYSKVKTFFDDRLGSFDVAVNNTPSYPSRLAVANERVPLIYYRGNINLIDKKSVSVVGARAASAEGCARAARLAKILAQNGIAVVSGLAAGIDTAALTSCIEHGGSVIGVIGTPHRRGLPKAEYRAAARDSSQSLARKPSPLLQIRASTLQLKEAVLQRTKRHYGRHIKRDGHSRGLRQKRLPYTGKRLYQTRPRSVHHEILPQ